MPERLSPQRFFLGGLLVAAGVLLMVSRLGLFDLDIGLWDLWPLCFVALGISAVVRGEWTNAILFFFLGSAFLLPEFFPEHFDFIDILGYWPLAVVLVGLTLVMRSFGSEPRKAKKKSVVAAGQTAFLRNVVVAETDQDYAGSDLTAILGIYKLDLTKAALASDGAIVDVLAFWGGIEITVPRGMAVDLRAVPFMGGSEDSSLPPPAVAPEAPRLVVRGFVWMAGLEIKN